jgi:surface polysaccharide O-acyltransferase-like enzyme
MPSPRFPLLDALRVVAMLDIVAIHVTGHYLLYGMGLPAFIIVSVALAVRRAELPTVGDTIRKRASRILLPWLVWTAFFGVNRLLWAAADPDRTVGDLFFPWMLAAGTSIHLWFLPFIFVAEVAVVAGLRPLRRWPAWLVVGIALMLAIVCIVWTGRVYDAHDLQQYKLAIDAAGHVLEADSFGWMVRKSWLFGTASVCLGVVVGRTLSLNSAGARRWLLLTAAGSLGLYWVWAHVPGGPIAGHAVWQWWRQAIAFFCVAAAVQWVGQTPVWLMRVALLTMGIYLLHGWVHARVYHQLLPWLTDRPAMWDILWPLGEVAYHSLGRIGLTWLITALLVLLLRRTAVGRVL